MKREAQKRRKLKQRKDGISGGIGAVEGVN